jgi:hypothetical protein
MIASLVNHAWYLSALPSARRFERALATPELAQRRVLERIILRNAHTAFGREHNFAAITSPKDFARQVPLRRYDELAPWIQRIAGGDPNILTADPVERLVPSSGSTAARKLIPFTRGLRQDFNAALAPWICDLFSSHPTLAEGRAYWSISPAIPPDTTAAIPIGFDDDSAYLGSWLAPLVARALAVPPEVARLDSIHNFRYATLLFLLRCADLRLISVWHPSFLSLLLDELPNLWPSLVRDIHDGTCSLANTSPASATPFTSHPNPSRAATLEHSGPYNTQALWPSLTLISCWTDAAATIPAQRLRERFPHVHLQPKGLLATEGVITFPIGNAHPIAALSHYFEFLDDTGVPHPLHHLERGSIYEVVLTTSGGLYRYRLGDLIRIDGHLAATPTARFLGRADAVSDLVGEKLSEAFVTQALTQWCETLGLHPTLCLLAPNPDSQLPGYSVLVDAHPASPSSADILDQFLCASPHYQWARQLGQLRPITIESVGPDALARYQTYRMATGARLGDIKPASLLRDNHARTAILGTDALAPPASGSQGEPGLPHTRSVPR